MQEMEIKMSKIVLKQLEAAPINGERGRPYIFFVMLDGVTIEQFRVSDYETVEAAKAAAQACLDRYEAEPWISPFLRYRTILKADYSTAQRLASLCLNLWNGKNFRVDVGDLLAGADSKHRAIAFELMESYALMGVNDKHFTALCEELWSVRR